MFIQPEHPNKKYNDDSTGCLHNIIGLIIFLIVVYIFGKYAC